MARTILDTDAETLIARHVAPHPANVGLDEYWLLRAGVSVWAVIGALKANDDNAEAVARLYCLTPDELDAACAFYARHRAVIDNRLAQNSAA